MHRYHILNSIEKNVLIEKGTDRPGVGKFTNYDSPGVYLCRQCDAPLYLSSDKFSSHCGWPSFDAEIPGTVKKLPDKDGERIEILCKKCGGHLGHLFSGEELTKNNLRYCVNSTSLSFTPAFTKEGYERVFFAAGCFWGVEDALQKLKGVKQTKVGFMGGEVVHPSYKEVCYNETKHAETVEVLFNPEEVSFESLTKYFFEIHNPTEVNKQGPDIGSQYRSVIFFLTKAQANVALQIVESLKKKGISIATEVVPASAFYPAEEEHQKYCQKRGL